MRQKKIFLVVGLFFIVNYSFACSCIGGKPNVDEAMNTSDLVFKGKLIEKKIFVIDTLWPSKKMIKYTFKVEKSYKGKKKYKITIVTGLGHGDCGYRFNLGIEYIVYAKKEKIVLPLENKIKKFFVTDICTRTTYKVKEEGKKIKAYIKQFGWLKCLYRLH